ncbi:MAG: hypothetical protein MJ137_05090, partial [Clostridia bacterium]|nr:hypothetical protein [Clostridia bacterium]
MKKKIAVALICIVLICSLLPFTAMATDSSAVSSETPWSSKYYRVMDITGALTTADIKSIDSKRA